MVLFGQQDQRYEGERGTEGQHGQGCGEPARGAAAGGGAALQPFGGQLARRRVPDDEFTVEEQSVR